MIRKWQGSLVMSRRRQRLKGKTVYSHPFNEEIVINTHHLKLMKFLIRFVISVVLLTYAYYFLYDFVTSIKTMIVFPDSRSCSSISEAYFLSWANSGGNTSCQTEWQRTAVVEEEEVVDETIDADGEEAVGGCWKSKLPKVPPKTLLGHYECDIRFLNQARKAVADSNNLGGTIDNPAKFSVILVKMKEEL